MKIFLKMLSAAAVIGALRVKDSVVVAKSKYCKYKYLV